jgi:hypothetical protein
MSSFRDEMKGKGTKDSFASKMVTKFCKIWLYNAYNELSRLKEAKFLLLNH